MKQRQHWYSLLLTGSLIVAAAVALPPEGNGFFERVAAFVGGEMADAEGPVFETEGSLPGEEGAQSATPSEDVRFEGPGQQPAGNGEGAKRDGGAGNGGEDPETPLAAVAENGALTPLSQGLDASAQGGTEDGAPAPAAPEQEAKDQTSPESGGEGSWQADFSTALFIGDSRTVGLSEYGGLDGATVFANKGMSVFNVLSAEVEVDGRKTGLEALLAERQFATIYLMLGINELGYSDPSIVKQYSKVVDLIQSAQPDAYVILGANLHVTKQKSDQNPAYGNDRINAVNRQVYEIAVDKGCGYIDVNSLFDDETGSLGAGYSSDGVHILGKYYRTWAEWIREQKA